MQIVPFLGEPQRPRNIAPTARTLLPLDQAPNFGRNHVEIDLEPLTRADAQRFRRSSFLAEDADLTHETRDVFLPHDTELEGRATFAAIEDASASKLRGYPKAQQQVLHVARESLVYGRIRNPDLIAVLDVDAAVARKRAIQEQRQLLARQLEDRGWNALLMRRFPPE